MSNIDLGIQITAFNNATNGIRGASSDVKQLGENAQAASNRLKAIQVVISGIILQKTLEWGKALVAASAAVQGLDLRLSAFAGGAGAANKVWDDLSNTFGATPFKIATIVQAWTHLRAVMGSNDAVTTAIKAVVNDIAAMGGTDENIANVSDAIQRMFSRGYVQGREYNSILVQTGLSMQDLAKAAGVSANTMARNLQYGLVSAQQFVDDFVKASNAKFGFFAENLKGSIAGATALMSNAFSEGLRGIGQNTNFDAVVTVIFQKVAAAITQVMNSIDQSKIDSFFTWLQDILPFLAKVANSLITLGEAFLEIGATVFKVLGSIPQEALTAGIVGYLFFGRLGKAEPIIAAIVGVGLAADKLKTIADISKVVGTGTSLMASGFLELGTIAGGIIAEIVDWNADLGKSMYDLFTGNWSAAIQDGKNLFSDIADTAAKTWAKLKTEAQQNVKDIQDIWSANNKPSGAGTFGISDADLAKIKAQMDAIRNGLGNTGGGGDVTSPQMQAALQASASFASEVNAQIQQAVDKTQQLNYETGGDQLGAKLSALSQQADAFNRQVAAAVAKFDALKAPTADAKTALQGLLAAQLQWNAAIDAAKENAHMMAFYQDQQLVAADQQKIIANDLAASMLKMQSSQNIGANIFLGSGAGQAVLANLQQVAAYKEQIASLDGEIVALEAKINAERTDPTASSADKAVLASTRQLRDATQKALDASSAEAQAQTQLWQNVGQALQNDVADGLVGLINGTETLGDVARKVFSDLIELAIKYLVQLLLIQAAQSFGIPLANGGVVSGGVSPFANGGVFKNNVKPFANGDILTGPTLFGLAGEAGDEAIMPLTRIGGKLGVRASGGSGGNHYHIHLNAIDTQTGMEFIGKNIQTIDQHLQHQKRLNHGAK